MKNQKILTGIRKELKSKAKKENREGAQRFFKEKIYCYGVKTPIVRKIGRKYFKEIKSFEKKKIFSLAKELLKSKHNEESTIAIQWISSISDRFEKEDFKTFENWLDKYIDNWGKDDYFCLHVIHPMIEKYPSFINKVKSWSKSNNMWLRRASAVSFITTTDKFYSDKKNINHIFEVAESLLNDEEDLVQKGYGWMLKAASIHKQREIFKFVMKHKKTMPRTALRYAIEKMPANLRKEAMKKD